jgi:hypothetical protein
VIGEQGRGWRLCHWPRRWGNAVDRDRGQLHLSRVLPPAALVAGTAHRRIAMAGSNVWSPVAVASSSDRGRREVRWMGGTNPLSIPANHGSARALGRT